MSRVRFTALLIAALVVLAAALYVGSGRNSGEPSAEGARFLPQLASTLGTVSEIDLQKGSPTAAVTLHRAGDQWSVAQRADYPADASKVHKLLLSLADAKIVEEKTSDPANFAIIGVEDPGKPGAAGTQITLTTKDGKHSAIVGKPTGEGNFARRGGENRSFTVAPGITADVEPRTWIDSRLLDIPVAQIQSVAEKLAAAPSDKAAAGPGYALHRLKAGEDGFLDLERIHKCDNVEGDGRLLGVPKRCTRKKPGCAIAAQIRDDHTIARRSQQRGDIHKAVNVVGPAVEKNDHRAVRRAGLRVRNRQEAGIDLLQWTDRGVDPRSNRGDIPFRRARARLRCRGTQHAQLGGSHGERRPA